MYHDRLQKIVKKTPLWAFSNFINVLSTVQLQLLKIHKVLQVCSLSFKQMNHVSDFNSYRTIETIALNLPTHVQQEWLKIPYKVIKRVTEHLFVDLAEFVK